MQTTRDRSWHSDLLQNFGAIELHEMSGVALLHRTDTKCLLSEMQLLQALGRLAGHYRILEIDGH